MATPIRTKKLNRPNCKTDAPISFCKFSEQYFDVVVESRSQGDMRAQPVLVRTWHLESEMVIEVVYDDCCDPLFMPLSVCGKEVRLNACNPEVLLTMPGKYRFRMTDYSNIPTDGDFAYQAIPVNPAYAELWLLQNKCCC